MEHGENGGGRYQQYLAVYMQPLSVWGICEENILMPLTLKKILLLLLSRAGRVYYNVKNTGISLSLLAQVKHQMLSCVGFN